MNHEKFKKKMLEIPKHQDIIDTTLDDLNEAIDVYIDTVEWFDEMEMLPGAHTDMAELKDMLRKIRSSMLTQMNVSARLRTITAKIEDNFPNGEDDL